MYRGMQRKFYWMKINGVHESLVKDWPQNSSVTIEIRGLGEGPDATPKPIDTKTQVEGIEGQPPIYKYATIQWGYQIVHVKFEESQAIEVIKQKITNKWCLPRGDYHLEINGVHESKVTEWPQHAMVGIEIGRIRTRKEREKVRLCADGEITSQPIDIELYKAYRKNIPRRVWITSQRQVKASKRIKKYVYGGTERIFGIDDVHPSDPEVLKEKAIGRVKLNIEGRIFETWNNMRFKKVLQEHGITPISKFLRIPALGVSVDIREVRVRCVAPACRRQPLVLQWENIEEEEESDQEGVYITDDQAEVEDEIPKHLRKLLIEEFKRSGKLDWTIVYGKDDPDEDDLLLRPKCMETNKRNIGGRFEWDDNPLTLQCTPQLPAQKSDQEKVAPTEGPKPKVIEPEVMKAEPEVRNIEKAIVPPGMGKNRKTINARWNGRDLQITFGNATELWEQARLQTQIGEEFKFADEDGRDIQAWDLEDGGSYILKYKRYQAYVREAERDEGKLKMRIKVRWQGKEHDFDFFQSWEFWDSFRGWSGVREKMVLLNLDGSEVTEYVKGATDKVVTLEEAETIAESRRIVVEQPSTQKEVETQSIEDAKTELKRVEEALDRELTQTMRRIEELTQLESESVPQTIQEELMSLPPIEGYSDQTEQRIEDLAQPDPEPAPRTTQEELISLPTIEGHSDQTERRIEELTQLDSEPVPQIIQEESNPSPLIETLSESFWMDAQTIENSLGKPWEVRRLQKQEEESCPQGPKGRHAEEIG
jgi:hypothetical protein